MSTVYSDLIYYIVQEMLPYFVVYLRIGPVLFQYVPHFLAGNEVSVKPRFNVAWDKMNTEILTFMNKPY